MEGTVLPCGSFHDLDPDSVLNGELDSTIADYLSQILRAQYPSVSGLLPPSQLYVLVRENRPRQKLPPSEFCVQIHVYPGHYLVSAQINGSVTVIDSLDHPSHLPAVMPQLKFLYSDAALNNLQYRVPQSQGATNLCGFFSVANAQYLLQNKCLPCITNFNISEMRKHLRKSIIEGILSPFPSGHSVCSNNFNAKDRKEVFKNDCQPKKVTHNLISEYFQDQKQKSEWEKN